MECKNSTLCERSREAFDPCSAAIDFGYSEGKPCVFLKLNKIYDWKPKFYANIDELPENMPEVLKEVIRNHVRTYGNLEVVWVSCEGETSEDIKNLGNKLIYRSKSGEQGFSGQFFPFKNVEGYLQPIVTVQFSSIKREF